MKRELTVIAVTAMWVAGCATQPTAKTVSADPHCVAELREHGSLADAQSAPEVVAVVGPWTSCRKFNFSYNEARLQIADSNKSAAIAALLRADPSLQVAIDGTMDPRGSDAKDQGLSDRRVEAVRVSLLRAGVPVDRIRAGAFGDELTRRDRCVEVLLATAI